MKDIELLDLLNDYYTVQCNVVTSMMWAMEDFERNREQASWSGLLNWCEAKDECEALWKRIQPHYVDAVMLKEGVAHDRDH